MTGNNNRVQAIAMTALMLLSVVAMSGLAAAAPQVDVSATDDAGTVAPGETFTVTYEYTNTGDEAGDAGRIEFSTPDGVEAVSIEGDGTSGLGGTPQSVLYGFSGPIEPGETLTTTVTFEVSASAAAGDQQVDAEAFIEGSSSSASASTSVTIEGGTAPSQASVVFSDQDSENGDSVLIDSAAPGDEGEVLAVWNLSNGAPDTVLGQISLDNSVTNEVIQLSPAIDESQTLVAAVHSGSPTANNILATDTATVTPVQADAVTGNPDEVSTFWQGQVVVLQGDFTAGEDYQLREVDGAREDREVGSLEREVRAVNDGRLIIRTDRVDADTYVVEDDNTALAPGDNLPTDLSAYNGFALEVAEQELDATLDQDSYTSGDTVALTLDSNRAGYTATVSAQGEVLGTFTDLGDFETVEFPAPAVDDEQDVQFNVSVDDTTTTASDTATVSPADDVVYQDVGAEFNASTVGSGDQQVGDIVEVTVQFDADYSNYDDDDKFQTYITLGDAGSGFVDLVRVRDEDRDGQATFTINTYRLGTTSATETGVEGLFTQDDTSAVYNVAGQSRADVPSTDNVAPEPDDPADNLTAFRVTEEFIGTTAFNLESQLSRPVDPDTYTVRSHNFSQLEAGETPIGTNQQSEGTAVVTRLSYPVVVDTSSLSLQERDVGELRTWIAPSGANIDSAGDVASAVEAGTLTQSSQVAQQDTLVIEINAEGLGGQIAAAAAQPGVSAEEAFTGYDGSFLVVEQQNPRANTDRFYLDVDGPGVDLIQAQASDTYYLVVDTARAQDARTGAGIPTNAQFRPGTYEVDYIQVGGSAGGGTFADYFEEGDFPSEDTAAFDAIFPGFGEGVVSPFDPYKDQNEQTLRNVSVDSVERRASFDRIDPDGNLRVVGYEGGSTVSGTTTLAPGSTFTVQLQNDSGTDRSFIVRQRTTVSSDQTWSIDTDLSDVPTDPATEFRATVLEGGQVIVGSAQADLEGNVPGLLLGAATIDVADSQETRGERVVVDSVFLPQGGFVTIHDASLTDGAVFDSVRGTSQYLPPGTHENVGVQLDSQLEETSQTVIPMAHQDTNENQVYDFVTSEGAEDGPYTTIDRSGPVIDQGTVEVPSLATPTPTPEPDTPTPEPDTPTPEPDTPTPTMEPTDTPTDEPTTATDGQPGFTAVLAVLALLAAALLAYRRD